MDRFRQKNFENQPCLSKTIPPLTVARERGRVATTIRSVGLASVFSLESPQMTDNEKQFFAQHLEYVTERTSNKQPTDKLVELAATDRLVRGFGEFRQKLGQ